MTLNDLQLHRDGNAWFVARPDFVDLAESDVYWLRPEDGDAMDQWAQASDKPLAHLPPHRIAEIIHALNP